jgi:alkylation response protein AidB-like acyl-CoA dehydrogenase
MSELTVDEVRAQVDAWVDANWDPTITVREWWKRLAGAGYAAPMLPVAVGGLGYSRDLMAAVNAVLSKRGCVGPPMGIGLGLAAPTIAVHGTADQKATLIPRILDGSDGWCQLFSEPNSGSDLAGLQCRAELDGDEYVVTGQKVWTTSGQHADKAILMARTNFDLPKHQGITYFAFDMHQPGVEVRPLREMTGHAMFNEVFLTEARVPASAIIGGLNNGWAVANTTLTFERASIGSGGGGSFGVAIAGTVAGHLDRPVGEFIHERPSTAAGAVGPGTVRQFIAIARQHGRIDEPVVRQQLAELYILTEVNKLNVARARSGQHLTGVEGNLAKMLMTHTLRRARDIGSGLLGAQGALWGPQAETGGLVQEMTVYSPGPSIYGGTDQIQRNIAAERGLGLPKEPGDFRTTAFKDLTKNG